MSTEATDQNTKMDLLKEQELDIVTAGGHSRCEGDDGRGTGGSSGGSNTTSTSSRWWYSYSGGS